MNILPKKHQCRSMQQHDASRVSSVALCRMGVHTEALEAQFRKLGWKTVLVSDGTQARLLACQGRVQAVVIPVVSPTESGLLTCVKLLAGSPHTQVYLFGENQSGHRRDARLAGATGLLHAGLSSADFSQILRSE